MVNVFKHIDKIKTQFTKDVARHTDGCEDGSHEFETEIAVGGEWCIINWSYWQDTYVEQRGTYDLPTVHTCNGEITINWCMIDEDSTELNSEDLEKLSALLI